MKIAIPKFNYLRRMITGNALEKEAEEPEVKEANEIDTPNSPSYFKENKELEKCNDRLERYIVAQRTKDQKIIQLENKIEELRNGIASEKERIRKSIKKSYDKLRSEKNVLQSKLALSKAESEKLLSLHRKDEMELESKTENLKRCEKRLTSLIKKREKDLAILKRLNHLAHDYKTDSNNHLKSAEFYKSESEALRDERDRFLAELNLLQSKKETHEAETLFVEKTYNDMVESYEKQIKELKMKTDDIEENLRSLFTEQFNESLESRQRSFNKEKSAALNELAKVYEAKVSSAKKELKSSSAELEQLKLEAERLVADYKKEKAEKEIVSKNLEAQTQKVLLLETKIANINLKPIRKKQRDAHVLKLMKEAYRKKEAECERLHENKVAMMMQIQLYREILDEEEHRVDSLKKERRSEVTTAAVTKAGRIRNKRRRAEKTRKTEVAHAKDGPASDSEQSLEELQAELMKEAARDSKEPSQRGVEEAPSPNRRPLRSRRTSGRPEGVLRDANKKRAKEMNLRMKSKPKSAAKKEHVAPEALSSEDEAVTNCVLECLATKDQIVVTNKSSKPAFVSNWLLRKDNDPGDIGSVAFPAELKQKETFAVFPTEEAKESCELSETAYKKVWNERAFDPQLGDVSILDENGHEMYKLEFIDKDEME